MRNRRAAFRLLIAFWREIPRYVARPGVQKSCALCKSRNVRYAQPVAQLTFQRARTEEEKRQRAEALVEAARSLAMETGVASVTLTALASRAGIHYSAVRRYFT